MRSVCRPTRTGALWPSSPQTPTPTPMSSAMSLPIVLTRDSTCMADNDGVSDDARLLRPLQAAGCNYRIAFGPRAGQKVLAVQGTMPGETDFKQSLCAESNGFSLHAAVSCCADDRHALEQPCRYITCPALDYERVRAAAVGQGVLKLKTSWRDGTTHLVMSPLEFMQRMARLCADAGCTWAASTECWRERPLQGDQFTMGNAGKGSAQAGGDLGNRSFSLPLP